MRRAACEAAVELFLEDDSVAIVLAEISVDLFAPAFAHAPERAINVGIMEQTMVGVAAGFALEGFRPVVHTIAPFLTERAHEQVKVDFGYQRLEGLFVSTGASYDYSTSGMTHHCPGDVAAMSTVPGIARVRAGSACGSYRSRTRLAHERGIVVRADKWCRERGGSRPGWRRAYARAPRGSATVIAVGPMLDRVLAAVAEFDVTVLYATTVYPLDGKMLREHVAPSPDVVLVEPMYEGTTTAQVAGAFQDRAVRLLSVGVPREVIEGYGTVAELDVAVGLDEEALARRIAGFLQTREGTLKTRMDV